MKKAYNIIINTGDVLKGNGGFITYHKVHSVDKWRKMADEKFPDWKFATVYDHATKAKINVITPFSDFAKKNQQAIQGLQVFNTALKQNLDFLDGKNG